MWQILNRVFERSFIGAQRNQYGFFVKEQESAMPHIFNGRDVMAILPTGFGKSLIFQLFVTMCGVRSKRQGGIGLSGIIVISPLQRIIQGIVRFGR